MKPTRQIGSGELGAAERRRRRRWWLISTTGIALGVSAIIYLLSQLGAGTEETTQKTPPLPPSQVLGFGDRPGQPPAPAPASGPAPTPAAGPEPGRLVLEPATVDFGTIQASQQPIERTVQVRNVGGQPVRRPEVVASGGAKAVLLCAETIAPGQRCDLTLSYVPSIAGSDRGEVMLSNDGRGQAQRIGYAIQIQAPAGTPAPVPVKAVAINQTAALIRGNRQAVDATAVVTPVAVPAAAAAPLDRPEDAYAEIGLKAGYASEPVNRNHMLTPDMYVSAGLETDLLSTIGGDIVAVVRAPVISRGEPRLILLDKGDRFVGSYTRSSASEDNGNRTEVEWREIWRGNGIYAQFAWPASDQMGRLGLVGELQQQLVARYGAQALETLVAIGGIMMTPSSQVTQSTSAFGTTTTGDPRNQALLQEITQSRQRFASLTEQVFKEAYPGKPANVIPAGTMMMIRPKTALIFGAPRRTGEPVQISAAAPAPASPVRTAGAPAQTSGQTGRVPASQARQGGGTVPARAGATAPATPAPAAGASAPVYEELEDVPADPPPDIRQPPPYTPPPILAR